MDDRKQLRAAIMKKVNLALTYMMETIFTRKTERNLNRRRRIRHGKAETTGSRRSAARVVNEDD